MKLITCCCILISLCGLLINRAQAKSPVWKISKDGQHLFLGGTIHLLGESDYPLPEAFEAAYKQSVILVLEADTAAMATPKFQKLIMQKGMYPEGKKITDFLKPETIQLFKKYLAERGIPLASLERYKPGMLSSILTVMELQKLGLAGTGVDAFFRAKASGEEKEIQFLESAADQLEMLANMGLGNEDEYMQYGLKETERISEVLDQLKNAWRSGDNAALQKVALDPWVERFPKLYDTLLVERNNDWVPQIEKLMKTNEIEFVLFGALHLAGEQGLLAQLEKLGYTIENQ